MEPAREYGQGRGRGGSRAILSPPTQTKYGADEFF